MRHYTLTHHHSHLGVAFFSPRLAAPVDLTTILEMVQTTPKDAFLRAEARRLLAQAGQSAVRALAGHTNPNITALALETVLLHPDMEHLTDLLQHPSIGQIAAATPLVFLRSYALPDAKSHRAWSRALGSAVFEHAPLPDGLPPLPTIAKPLRPTDALKVRTGLSLPPATPRPPLPQVLSRAMEALYGQGVLIGPELRHGASLAPWGLTRSWRLDRTVEHGTLAYRLTGTMTSYGRGRSLEAARVSLAMEIVERISSFADIRGGRITGRIHGDEIRTARPHELGSPALDLNQLCLEAPAPDAPLAWMTATTAQGAPIWVPVQCVYLFTNLDEPKLFGALGSTGLASGSTVDEACLAGLLEVLERDAETVSPWQASRAFRPQSRDPEVQKLLDAYAAQGIDLVLENITTEFGVPCMRAWISLAHGGFVKATAAHLCGKAAALAAITEVPFPFPQGPASGRWDMELPTHPLEDLPDLSTGSAAGDRILVEALLADQGLFPIYADLTQRSMGIPVVRTIIPGLETATDLDEFSRISPRLAAAATRLMQCERSGPPPATPENGAPTCAQPPQHLCRSKGPTPKPDHTRWR